MCTASDGVFGDVVTYSCLPGYFDLTESGTGQRTCDTRGTWVTDDTDPYCEIGEKESKKRERGGVRGWGADRIEKKRKKTKHERKDPKQKIEMK